LEKENFETNIQSVMEILEEGYNNLAYYLGSDLNINNDLFSLKTFSAFKSKGRADIANLSNILVPLREIRNIIITSSNITEALKQYFMNDSNSGARHFGKRTKGIIKRRTKEVLDNKT
jgi:hypothetical protein